MYDAIRQAVVGYIDPLFALQFADVPLVHDNSPFDYDNPPECYTELEVEFYGGEQIGMAADPRTRVSGYVYAQVTCRRGLGSAKALQILAWVASALEYKTPGGVHLQAAESTGSTKGKAWYTCAIKVAFYKDP